jgi:hypothetical protein
VGLRANLDAVTKRKTSLPRERKEGINNRRGKEIRWEGKNEGKCLCGCAAVAEQFISLKHYRLGRHVLIS